MSNSFNKPRQIVKRPKICLPPNPPIPPPPGITCGFDPAFIIGPQNDIGVTECFARNTAFPSAEVVGISQVTGFNLDLITVDIPNDGLLHTFEIELLEPPGVYAARYEFEFSDESFCLSDLQVTVT